MAARRIVDDAVLGAVTVPDPYDPVEATVRYRGGEVTVSAAQSLDLDEPARVSEAIERARTAALRLEQLADAAARYAASSLLRTAWDWNERDEPIEAAEFGRRLTLGTVEVAGSGWWTLWFGDGQIFHEHTVKVDCTAEGVFFNADITG